MQKNRNRRPQCVVNIIEHHEVIRDYVIKQRQYIEHSGKITITEPEGLNITRAIVSGRDKMEDITDIIKLIWKQGDYPKNSITIDTDLFNQYTDGDIECGTRKIVEIEYITKDRLTENKKVRKIKKCNHRDHEKPHKCDHEKPPKCDHEKPPKCNRRKKPKCDHEKIPKCNRRKKPKCDHEKTPHCGKLKKRCDCNNIHQCIKLSENTKFSNNRLFLLFPIHCPTKYCGKNYSQLYPIRGSFKHSISPDLICYKNCKCKDNTDCV